MAFHHTKIVQRERPKPHLRLHTRIKTHGEGQGRQWLVTRHTMHVDHISLPLEATTWWSTSRLALDAAFYQFSCEWPAGRRGR